MSEFSQLLLNVLLIFNFCKQLLGAKRLLDKCALMYSVND